jgi:acetyl-CoA carboxylase carboxyltransferase component
MNSMEEKLNERIAAKAQAKLAVGQAAVEQRHQQGRLTARERIEKLVDPGTFQELDLLLTSAESELDPAAGGIPSDGVITGYAEANGRALFVWSQDGDVLGGSVGVIHAKKMTWLLEKALQMRVPIVGIVDSVGERAADLIEYPHFYSLESVCRLQTAASGVIPQIVMVMGPCVGGMAIVAQMADFLLMVRGTSYMHIAQPPEGVGGRSSAMRRCTPGRLEAVMSWPTATETASRNAESCWVTCLCTTRKILRLQLPRTIPIAGKKSCWSWCRPTSPRRLICTR